MNFLQCCMILTVCIPSALLHAMQQPTENPFREFNNDPKCPYVVEEYDHKTHYAYLREILESETHNEGPAWKYLTARLSQRTLANIMSSIRTSVDSLRCYIMLTKQTPQTGICCIQWDRLKQSKYNYRSFNTITEHHGPLLHIQHLTIAAQYRRQGIASWVMNYLLKHAQSEGMEEVAVTRLAANREQRKMQREFFKSLGFSLDEHSSQSLSIFYIKNLQKSALANLSQKSQEKRKGWVIRPPSSITSIAAPPVASLTSEPLPIEASTPPTTTSTPLQTKQTQYQPNKKIKKVCTQNNSRWQTPNPHPTTIALLGAVGMGGALMSLACITRCAPQWMQQRSRYAYGITALGALSYGAARWMRNKSCAMKQLQHIIMMTIALYAGCLRAMVLPAENPFQELNDDPQSAYIFVKYDAKLHNAYVEQIFKSVIKPGNKISEPSKSWPFQLNNIGADKVGKGVCGDSLQRYIMLTKSKPVRGVCCIQWSKFTLSNDAQHSKPTEASRHHPGPLFHIHHLAVATEYQGKHIASRTVHYMLQHAKAKNMQEVTVALIRNRDEQKLQKFFKSLGFFEDEHSDKNSNLKILHNKLQDKNVIRIFDMTSKICGIGGALMSLACITRYAQRWLQQQSRYAYGITALGALSYGAARLMRNKSLL